MQRVKFLDYFEELEDPRSTINLHHQLNEILFLTLCATICGAEGWNDSILKSVLYPVTKV